MDDLCSYAYEACRQSVTIDTIHEWLEFIDGIPSQHSSNRTATADHFTSTSVYGFFAQRLRDDVFTFLVVTLPAQLNINQHHGTNGTVSSSGDPTSPSGRETLLHIFSRVPFDLFKASIESSTFQIGTYPP
jgi:hypothetical protein